MWLYVMFDLPVETKRQRKDAAYFRKMLIKDGFTMYQFSVYTRPCASNESAQMHIERIRLFVPDDGLIAILRVTDKQFGDTIQLVGRKRKPQPPAPVQLEFL